MHSPGTALVRDENGQQTVSTEAVIALNRAKLLGSGSYRVVEHKVQSGYEFESDSWRVRGIRQADNTVRAEVEAVERPKQWIVDLFKLRINGTLIDVTIPHDHLENADYIFQWVGECYASLPDSITSHIPNVVLAPHTNPYDPYWREKYSDPNHTSLATAGFGTLTFYLPVLDKEGIQSPLKVLHEMGHEIARIRYGDELAGDEWRVAMERDKASVSHYGDNCASEDFAEAFAHFAYSMLPPNGQTSKGSSKVKAADEEAVSRFREVCRSGRIPVLEKIFLNGVRF